MPEAFLQHMIYSIKVTWVLAFVFVMWPFAFALGGSAMNPSPDGQELGLREAIRRSFSSYLGFDKEAVHRGNMVFHRIVGALAWAYVVALFIASIG